ncbi:MAG: hypothetical protein AB8B96_18590 [Lysobacterales bacterium]
MKTLLAFLFLYIGSATAGNVLYVATDGNDNSGTGDIGNPLASIQQAVNSASDGDLILVRPGEYFGRQRLDRQFTNGITIRSEIPYMAQLRNNQQVVTVFSGQGITIEGFDIAHDGPGASPLVFQVQDTIAGQAATSRIVIRNNILHDSYNNDILKVNNGARSIDIVGNIFYNQTGSDEHIDANSVVDVSIVDNVFFNDFAASGRSNNNSTSSFIVVKDSNATDDDVLGSANIEVSRNVFLNWQGSAGSNFLLLGEDGASYFEVQGAVVENNLMIGNSNNTMRAAFGAKGVSDVLFRHNTIVGNLPASGFAFRLNIEGSNQPVTDVRFYNNIWSDPTGTMNRFSNTPAGESTGSVLTNNLYWNGGASIPQNGNDVINSADDFSAVLGDPVLASQVTLVVPVWNSQTSEFADGSQSIRQAHRQLVERFGTPGPGSSAIDVALGSQVPSVDILGTPRNPQNADIGALERDNPDVLFRNSFES